MKKIIQTIKLRRFKSNIDKSSIKMFINDNHFLCYYKDGSCEEIYSKYDLINRLEKDHIKPIRYVFDMTDRIIIDRDIKINVEDI